MGSGPSHEKDDPNNNHNNNHVRDHRGSVVGDPASMRRMHWIIYDAKGKHSIIAEHGMTQTIQHTTKHASTTLTRPTHTYTTPTRTDASEVRHNPYT